MKVFGKNVFSNEVSRNIEILFKPRSSFKHLNNRQYKKALKNCLVVKDHKGRWVDLSKLAIN